MPQESAGMVVIATAMITCYAKPDDLESARQMFDGTTGRDCVCWDAMINGKLVILMVVPVIVLFGMTVFVSSLEISYSDGGAGVYLLTEVLVIGEFSIPGYYEAFWKELDGVKQISKNRKQIWKNRKELK
ncbi:uncharacterized protein A4U43_C07F24440 [Asparagus officinalis]|uniref:Uncharacterized protein n=1 Tax=Asparagus officinalis TaxID=4686 RepID=A0A5P1EEJ8_ASPOF|nr:uncharacterized protein A4U43_C07F24440 [Asparagus officinalis]